MPAGNITAAAEALSLVVLVRDERIGEKSFALFRKIMNLVRNDDRLWESARLSMKGAFSPIARVPLVGDLNAIFEFLHHHISSKRRTTCGDGPIYHSFRAIASARAETRRELARYDFASPLVIDTIVQVLANKGDKALREVALIILPELDDQLFISDKAFKDAGKAKEFVISWWAAVESCRTDTPGRVECAAAQVFFAIANSPCLRAYIPPDAWGFTNTLHYILEANPPSLRRCTQNSDLLAFVKQASPEEGLPSWMAMLWMGYESLSKDSQDQLEEETRDIVLKECEVSGDVTLFTRKHHSGTWISIFDMYLRAWEKRLGRLDPSDKALPGLRARRESTIRAKERLIEIVDEVKREAPPARWFWERDCADTQC